MTGSEIMFIGISIGTIFASLVILGIWITDLDKKIKKLEYTESLAKLDEEVRVRVEGDRI